MPDYVYGCGNHTQDETHAMSAEPVILCKVCGKKMHRIPQAFSVNWGGLPPHLEHTRPPAVQSMIDNADASRDKYLEKKGK